MAEEKNILPKLRKLYEAQRKIEDTYRAGMDAIAREVAELLAGGVGIGEILKRLEDHFALLWAVRYAPGWKAGDKDGYGWNYAADRKTWKGLLTKFSVEELERRAGAYHADSTPYYVQARHPFALFVSQINRFAGDASAPKLGKQTTKLAEAVRDIKAEDGGQRRLTSGDDTF
jgi:hypothetical protein